jgi:2-oxoisovalerate dehydrogenase E1 component
MRWDMLLSFASSAEDPISGGRHKVLGSRALMIPPQTSTIASHLPKAVGAAYSIGRPAGTGPNMRSCPMMPSSIAALAMPAPTIPPRRARSTPRNGPATSPSRCRCCSVCEDNGIGISTKTPTGWIAATFAQRPGLKYFTPTGWISTTPMRGALEGGRLCPHPPQTRLPAHLRTIRLYGHAGADMPTTYLSREEVEAEEANDPLLHSVRLLDQAGALAPDQALAIYTQTGDRVARVAAEAVTRPRLKTASEVMASICPAAAPARPTNGPPPRPANRPSAAT